MRSGKFNFLHLNFTCRQGISRFLVIFPFLFFFTGELFSQDTVSVRSDTTVLKLVTVASGRPLVEMKADKTVMNVHADLSAAVSNVLEILQKAPGVSITSDDVINMSGKAGVNVLIDGRPTQLSGRDLANYLRAMAGNTVDKIELITNPSSRYDAQGNAGIINIRLKKKITRGTTGNISAAYTQNVHYRSNGSFNISTKINKWAAYANSSIDYNKQHTSGNIIRQVNDNGIQKQFINETTDIDKNTRYNYRAGIDFFADAKNSVGLLLNGGGNRSPFNTPGTTLIASNGVIDSSLATLNENLYKNRRFSANLNYRYADTLGTAFVIDADYTLFNNKNATAIQTHFLDKTGSEYNSDVNTLDVTTRIDIYALKADYVRKIKKINGSWESGVKWSFVNTDNTLLASNLVNTEMKPDTGRSNRFSYSEKIYAAYSNISGKRKKWEYNVGFRIEQSVINGLSVSLDQKALRQPDTSYFNLFPSLFVSYQLKEHHILAASFSRRINRPDYQQMNPFETIFDVYTIEKGNPFLRPQFSYNAEVKYTYRYAVNVALGYNYTNDYSQMITRQNGQYTTATTVNLGTLNNAYLNISSPIPVNKWWEGYVNITGFLNHYKGQLPDGKLNDKATGLNVYIQHRFKLGKGWVAQASSWFNASTREAIFRTRSYGSVDAGIRKTFLSDKAAIRVLFNDIFNTQRWKQEVKFANQDFSYLRKWESRGIRLQFSWSFGNPTYENRQRETNKDADRIKQR